MEELHEKHLQDWNDFFRQRKKTLEQLEADELLIRGQFPVKDAEIPEAWKEKMYRQREAWIDAWGMGGAKAKELKIRHREEKKNLRDALKAEAEERRDEAIIQLQMYEYEQTNKGVPKYRIHPPSQVPGNEKLDMFYENNPSYAIRENLREELYDEQNAIIRHYQEKGHAVPLATQRRLAMHVSQFRTRWDGVPEEVPKESWKTLSKEDLGQEFKSWRDLVESHKVIEKMYHGPESNIPETTTWRMKADIEQFWKEMDAYKAKLAEQDKPSLDQDFKEQLQELQAKKRHSMKPRMG